MPRRRAAGLAPVLALALLSAAVLAACGPLPRPFQPERKGGNALLVLADRSGIVVAPESRRALGKSGRAADAMAAALRELNVPASTEAGNRDSHWLLGRAEVEAAIGGREAVTTVWELRGPGGTLLGRARHRAELPAGAWAAGRAEALRRAVAPAAAEIAALIQDPAPVAVELPGFPPGTRLAVAPLEAGPEAARRVLPGALGRALREAGLPVAARAGGGDIHVRGRVELGPPENGHRQVTVRWVLARAGGGEPLARLTQANRLPAGTAVGGWDELARPIARAAARGIAQALAAGAGGRE